MPEIRKETIAEDAQHGYQSSTSDRDNVSQKQLAPLVPSVLRLPVSDSSKTSSNISERARRLLESLEEFDSLYLCPTKKFFPDAVARRIHRPCVGKYEVKDYYGVTRYYAAELTSRSNYFFCSNARSFQIYMYDLSGEQVFESVRTCSCALCVTGVDCCCMGGIETAANFRNEENYIGSVHSDASCSTPMYKIQNSFLDEVYHIRGPTAGLVFPCFLCCIKQFAICTPKTLTSVGKIMYGYDGLHEDRIPRKMYPKTVGVIFPPRCSPEMKACLLTAGFMLDVTYFQKRGCTFQRILRYIFHLGVVAVLFFVCYIIVKSCLN